MIAKYIEMLENLKYFDTMPQKYIELMDSLIGYLKGVENIIAAVKKEGDKCET